jgi:activator of 2-hydroxyglutaryl-CoA dehydratase
MEGEIVVIGGVASNLDFIISLEEMIGGKLLVPPHPQAVGALGAAILAQKATP